MTNHQPPATINQPDEVTTMRFDRMLSLTLLAAGLFALAPQSAHAQLGLAAAYGADTELGAQLSYYRPINVGNVDGVRAGGDLTVYLPTDAGGGVIDLTYTYFEINVNGQYAFSESDKMRLYALTGANYAYLAVSGDTGFGAAGGGDAGLNLGAGADFGMFFGEAKFTLGGFSQLGLLVGLRFGGK